MTGRLVHAAQTRLCRQPERLRENYDVVVIGGCRGLATAYYLAREYGMRNVAVLARGELGSGLTGHDPIIISCNHLTPPAMRLYRQSALAWQSLSSELGVSLSYALRGHFTLAHSVASLRTLRWRAEVAKHYGVRCAVVDRAFIHSRLPMLALDGAVQRPVLGALYHEHAALAWRDAVTWGYANAASQLGIEIHQHTEVIGMDIHEGTVAGVRTTRGRIATCKVLCAGEGYTPQLLDMAGLRTPLRVQPLQVMVSEPLRRWLDPIVTSEDPHFYVSQMTAGELVMGASLDCDELHQARARLEFAESLARHLLDLFPDLGPVKVLRQSVQIRDTAPDLAPIMGTTPIEGLYLDAGWSTWGCWAIPLCGKTMSHTIATGRDDPRLEGLNLARFGRFELAGEKAAIHGGTLTI